VLGLSGFSAALQRIAVPWKGGSGDRPHSRSANSQALQSLLPGGISVLPPNRLVPGAEL
jgi:hypothetical protein